MKVYFDFNDWWIGYYRGDTHHYVCILPTLVIRWSRRNWVHPRFEELVDDKWQQR